VQGRFKPHLAYLASAGSGKTFALSVRYLSLLFLGEEASTILAATFTNKAASEMKQRVLHSLIHLESNPIFLEEIALQTGRSQQEILAEQPAVLERFLATSNFIVTLDSFFTSVLRSASLYIDLEPDFVTKEIESEHKEEIFLEEIQANSLLSELVKLAISIEDKRFVKIFELMQNFYRIDPLLPQREYPPTSLKHLEQEINQKREALYVLLQQEGVSTSALRNFEPMEIKELFKKGVFEKATLLDHRNYKKYVERTPVIDEYFLEIKALLGEWAKAKEQVVLYHLFQIFAYYKNANIRTAKQLGVLSFDDLTYFTYRLLHESINKEFLYFKIDSRFRHILLDEFQDTSTLQFLLLKPLIDEIFAGVGQQEFKSFFYVGDTKQSLYRFRGGVEELFDAVAQYYGIEIAKMETNYRSAKAIVAQVNHWFQPHMEGFYPAQYHRGAKEGYVEVVEAEAPIEMAIEKLEWLLAQGVALSDIALLVSTNKDGAMLQEACYLKGITTRLKTASSLKHTAKVASLVRMVRYLFEGLALDAQALLERVGQEREAVNLTWFHPFMEPLEVLHRLIGQFGYFEEDLNLLKLLEFATDFSDIATFLEEFELSSIEVASSAKEGAMIMTIHGSKGLEFEHVIVLDRLRGVAPDRSVLLYDYDENLHVKKIVYKMRGREQVDPSYADLLERQKRLQAKDRMNVLYVALTRAIGSLIVVRKPKASIFDPLGIQPLVVGNPPQGATREEEHVSCEPKRLNLSYYGVQELPNREEEGETDEDAMLFGRALHYTLEMMPTFDRHSLEGACRATANRYGTELTKEQLDAIEARILYLLGDEPFKQYLEGGVLHPEQSLSFEGGLLQIDLLVEYEDRALVIDYKSSQKFSFKHQQQVRGYVKAIESILKKPAQGLVVYLLESGVVLSDVKIK